MCRTCCQAHQHILEHADLIVHETHSCMSICVCRVSESKQSQATVLSSVCHSRSYIHGAHHNLKHCTCHMNTGHYELMPLKQNYNCCQPDLLMTTGICPLCRELGSSQLSHRICLCLQSIVQNELAAMLCKFASQPLAFCWSGSLGL